MVYIIIYYTGGMRSHTTFCEYISTSVTYIGRDEFDQERYIVSGRFVLNIGHKNCTRIQQSAKVSHIKRM